MTMPSFNPAHRLEAWYEADARYSVVPLPAPVDRAVAEMFAIPRIVRPTPASKIVRLSGLSILHDLAGTAKSWEVMIARPVESTPADVTKSAHAVAALAWVGNQDQWKKADEAYKSLLTRADPDLSRGDMALACSALGPPEGTAALRTWAAREADRLEKESTTPTQPRPPEGQRNLRVKSDMIRQFARLDVDRIDKDFAVRKAVDAIAKPEDRAPRLAALYCETAPDGSPALVWWSANVMVRLAREPGLRVAVIEALLKIARDHAKKDEEMQPELDATRARAYRAALYFGGILPPPDQYWLTQQRDHGTDILVLRPDWKYPEPHAHPNEQ
jgi:hypothetical protein